MPSTLLSALKLAAQSAANSLGELNFNTSPLEKLICINRTIQQFYAKLASLAKGKAQGMTQKPSVFFCFFIFFFLHEKKMRCRPTSSSLLSW